MREIRWSQLNNELMELVLELKSVRHGFDETSDLVI